MHWQYFQIFISRTSLPNLNLAHRIKSLFKWRVTPLQGGVIMKQLDYLTIFYKFFYPDPLINIKHDTNYFWMKIVKAVLMEKNS